MSWGSKHVRWKEPQWLWIYRFYLTETSRRDGSKYYSKWNVSVLPAAHKEGHRSIQVLLLPMLGDDGERGSKIRQISDMQQNMQQYNTDKDESS